ncbi:succinate-semialdehyde dehydrogenase / glutarate-semialdehyde dehydrogenase [Kordiimonas lacus]|uniref:Succinate-semialdehyde dehydrogenase / glutarate-semialdehyde dehydrogenase n=2 Tax=Kordiimonas lacus TaxID=637679 RepID=A0A1G7FE35_9PROT|nr:succinate-semialdehyde dehydrogenase / glutarate-semialdehyde dehydrogenase [Kordiimonas lacus]
MSRASWPQFITDVFDHAAPVGASTFDVKNPATGAVLGTVADMTAADARQAVADARGAFKAWSQETAKSRTAAMMAWHDLIVAHVDELAQLLTLEMGKPLMEAKGEILHGASYITWFAEEAKRLYGDIIPTNAPGRRLMVVKQPIGVVAAITPWNFPSAMIMRKVAPAIAAGCTVVIKPAEDTPLSAVALVLLAKRAGLPDDVIKLVTCSQPAEVAKALTDHPDVRKLSFTGSTRVGKLLMRNCANTVKKVSLELGGNAPFIVFDDADLDQAADAAMLAKFRNAGQTCISANRFLVQIGVYEAFAAKLEARVAALTLGDGMAPETTVGPLINDGAVSKVESLVRHAAACGAEVRTGGYAVDGQGTFFPPTILTGGTPDLTIADTEIFGPVAALYRFKDEDEAVRVANDTPYGLASYVFTQDMGRIWRVSEALEYGMVAVNEGTVSSEAAPFGGVKESGIGREGSRYGLDEFVEIKYIGIGGLNR